MLIRLGHDLFMLRATTNHGPGLRVAIWTQGCVHRCTEHCLNPRFLDPNAGWTFETDQVAAAMAAVAAREKAEGVTILGGEPFEQPAAVAALLQSLRASGLSTMVYSGHTHEHLLRSGNSGVAALLAETDILADGPFLPQLYSDRLAWRGSTNQRLICLTPRYTEAQLDAAFAAQGKGFSLEVRGGRISISGLQERGQAHSAEQWLARASHPTGDV
jgi:anaerobic ribonucleoside-triphosphate reductase activating protein